MSLVPCSGLKWVLSGDRHTQSDGHIDAGGLATAIIVILGIKIWLVALGSQDEMPIGADGWNIKKMRFQIVAIGEQDIL